MQLPKLLFITLMTESHSCYKTYISDGAHTLCMYTYIRVQLYIILTLSLLYLPFDPWPSPSIWSIVSSQPIHN